MIPEPKQTEKNVAFWGVGKKKKNKVHFFLNGQALCGRSVHESNMKWTCEHDKWDPEVNKDLVCPRCATNYRFFKQGFKRIPEAK